MPARFVDLSHPIEHGMVTYPGLPGPIISAHLSREASCSEYAEGVEFHIGRIDMVANTGTYLDSPFHRYADGADLAGLDLAVLADLEAVVVRDQGSAIAPAAFHHLDVAGKAVLVDTGWSRHWATPAYLSDNPYLTDEAAAWLAEAGPALVGIDSLNIDDTRDDRRPAHSRLLAVGVPIVEHLTGLAGLPDTGARFFAVPPAVRGFGTFPVRAFALVDGA